METQGRCLGPSKTETQQKVEGRQQHDSAHRFRGSFQEPCGDDIVWGKSSSWKTQEDAHGWSRLEMMAYWTRGGGGGS